MFNPQAQSRIVLMIVMMLAAVFFLPSTTQAAEGWYAEYYANDNLSGSPVLTRYDGKIDFHWSTGSPAPQIPADNFSARWRQTLHFEEGDYEFSVVADDGVRLFVDDVLIIDDWQISAAKTRRHTHHLAAGSHTVRLEYFENDGDATVWLWWELNRTSRPVGNIVTYADPGTWIKVYRRLPDGVWQDVNAEGWGPTYASGRLKIDGLPVDPYYGAGGQPYRVEMWTHNTLLRSVGNTDAGEAVFLVKPYFDNITPWGRPPALAAGLQEDGSLATGAIINASHLTVRRGPGLGYLAVAYVSRDQIVELTGYRNAGATWIQIRAGSVTGWINAAYIRTPIAIPALVVAP